jgi:hypothetical protein
MIVIDNLANIDHQIFYEGLAFTLLWSLPLSFHILVVFLSVHIDELSMDLVCMENCYKKSCNLVRTIT